MKQANLFDRPEAERQRDLAIQRVGQPLTAARWCAQALPYVEKIARSTYEFTTDRVEYELHKAGIKRPPEPKSMGNLMQKAGARGYAWKTDRTHRSAMPSNHSRPKAIWRSRLTALPTDQIG